MYFSLLDEIQVIFFSGIVAFGLLMAFGKGCSSTF